MKKYDIFAKPIAGGAEFLALHEYTGDPSKVYALAKSRGCVITRIYDLSRPVDVPNFIKCINL